MVTYSTVEKVVDRYRAYRREQGGDADTDGAEELAATFAELDGHEAWADRIGTRNRTAPTKEAPLKSFAIEAEAIALLGVGIVTAQQLRDAAEDPAGLERAMAEWLKVPGQRSGVTWHYFLMLAGIQGIKPDRMVLRFVAKSLDLPLRTVTPEFCIEILRDVGSEVCMDATDLDYAIWNCERGR
ncbi:hypothetical protein [Aldersonia kunmingensis]|uniref:hypothetical protein n=1 Tax=Aldersonia kunmingensis TaxID=408066 RepID=UPI001FE0BD7F|nr:hypothetical protein [Aldersonia kunmingensis]